MPEQKQETPETTTVEEPANTMPVDLSGQDQKALTRLTWTKFQQLKLRHKREKWAVAGLTPLIIITAVAALAYGSDFTLTKFSVANTPVNYHSSDAQLIKVLTNKSDVYRFSLVKPDNTAEIYKLSDAGISINEKETVQSIRSDIRQQGWQRFLWWQKKDVNFVINKNDKQYNAFVEGHIAIANQTAVDATLSSLKGASVLAEGTDGWTYALPGGNDQLAIAAKTLMPLKAHLTKTAIKPNTTSSDLKVSKQKLDTILGHTVSFSLPERTITATPSDIGGWLDFQAVPEDKTVDVTVNSGKISAWLSKATKNDIRPPRSQITTTDETGNTTVLSSGQNGMDITNKTAAINSVATGLANPESEIKTELTVAYQNYTTINAADYPKWIVADVTTKRMYAYEHATLIRSFLVSAGAPKTPTVIGTYKIYSKYVTKDMRGNNADGSRYFQPKVKYVNYFYKDYAIHGNYWRPTSYFGNINSSHGCVGITNSDAEWLYNWAPIGTTVITHK